MGQYYAPMVINPKARKKKVVKWWYAHKYMNGLKLMEHSYIGNILCNAVENYLLENPSRIVWAGDYADKEKCGDTNLYDMADDDNCVNEGAVTDLPKDCFVINLTKGQYYDRDKMYKANLNEKYGLSVNPLPLLTAEGNGQGGGDYFGINKPFVGMWARDEIVISTKEPKVLEEIYPYFECRD